jgi:hypothetical protein
MTFRREVANLTLLYAGLFLLGIPSTNAQPARKVLHGRPAIVASLTAQRRMAVTNRVFLAIGLPMKNQAEASDFLAQLYDPQSANFHKFITPQEFAEQFGPTETDYESVIDFAQANGLTVSSRHINRLVLDVEGNASDVERAFGVRMFLYKHPTEARDFFAPDTEPSVPAGLNIVTIEGLTDYALPKPHSRKLDPATMRALGGSGPSGNYAGDDFRRAYAPGSTLTGAGQAVGLLEFSDYFASDITTYENTIGRTNLVPVNKVVIGHPAPTTANNSEVALDIEVAIAIAPNLSQVIVYEIRNGPSSILSRMANDNLAKALSSSWTWSGGPNATIDGIFKQMAMQGQSYFQASGDSDAYTGSQLLDDAAATVAPVDSTNITCVGGTTLTMNGSGATWASETTWNWASSGGQYANVGSGGGISQYYKIPYWQTNVSMAANSGSTTFRNVPDVALTADQVYVVYNNGSAGGFGGTSCAAPLWAGFCALVNQQNVARNGTTVGFINPAIYAIAHSGNYANCFHDITTGNNIGVNTPGLFNAVPGFDLATGLGTPNGTNLIEALTAAPAPYFLSQPASQTVTNGANVSLSGSAGGQSPLVYHWLFNGTNLLSGGNVFGTTSNVLTITSATTNNSGSYQLVATNSFGSATSTVAILSVGFPPTFAVQPTNSTVLSGATAVLGATVTGSAPLAYQWRKNGTNLSNGAGISGATSNVLTLSSVTTNSGGNYSLFVTNTFGTRTSTVATLTVVLPAFITSGVTNQTIECGGNVSYSATASGTPPLSFQWSLDAIPIPGATNASLSLSNVHLPNHTVALLVTNLYGSSTSNAVLTVHDTIPPVIALNGTNPMYLELGAPFNDPSASASDICAGTVSVVTLGSVATNVVSTNTLTYRADDGSGNTNSATRTVIVRDTTPPTIVRSFTNLVVAAGTNCTTPMPDVTGTNYIVATDLSGSLSISQTPTNNTALPLGTNIVVITVKDASGNAAYSTNRIIVQDQAPPVFSTQPQNQTNVVGTTANFSGAASACTVLGYQWYFNNAPLPGKTNGSLTINPVMATNGGNYFVIATASGGSSTSVVATLTVSLISVNLSLSSSLNPSGFKDSLTFSAAVTPTNAAGAIQFLTNGAAFDSETLSNGHASSLSLTSLPRGSNLVTAIYGGDANHSSATNTLAQIVTNHPPIATPAYYTRIAGSSLSILISDLATNWSDVDGDTISLLSVGVSTNGVVLTTNSETLTYSNVNNVVDLFTCTIGDGWGGTNFEPVSISVTQPADPTPVISGIAGNPDGTFTLSLAGAASHTYILESAPGLNPPVNWSPINTNTLGTNSTWQFQDSQATNFPYRFYRLKLAP